MLVTEKKNPWNPDNSRRELTSCWTDKTDRKTRFRRPQVSAAAWYDYDPKFPTRSTGDEAYLGRIVCERLPVESATSSFRTCCRAPATTTTALARTTTIPVYVGSRSVWYSSADGLALCGLTAQPGEPSQPHAVEAAAAAARRCDALVTFPDLRFVTARHVFILTLKKVKCAINRPTSWMSAGIWFFAEYFDIINGSLFGL